MKYIREYAPSDNSEYRVYHDVFQKEEYDDGPYNQHESHGQPGNIA